MLKEYQQKKILELARTTMEDYITKGMIDKFITDDPDLLAPGGVFVTLHKDGQLRGCIGLIESDQSLIKTVEEMAIAASRNDPRFDPVNEYELKEIDIEVSILSPKKRVESVDDIMMEKHGVIVKKGFASGVFLPQVALESGWTKEEFMQHLCADKAGLHADAYLEKDTEIYVFEAQVFSEKD